MPINAVGSSMSITDQVSILAVEDNPDTQTLLRYLLRPMYRLELVRRVDEAVRAARKDEYQLFVLDINLGEQHTGIDLLHQLRSIPGCDETPALALTAYAMPGDRDRFLREGFDAYVSKPFTRHELLEAIEVVLQARPPAD